MEKYNMVLPLKSPQIEVGVEQLLLLGGFVGGITWGPTLSPGRCGRNCKSLIFEHILRINFMSTSCEIAFRWMPQNTFDDYSTLVWVVAWCRQTTSHYLSQCWPRSTSLHVALLSHSELIWYQWHQGPVSMWKLSNYIRTPILKIMMTLYWEFIHL